MLQKVINELHLYEKKILKALEEKEGKATPEEISKIQDMNIKAVMSAADSLESKDIIKIHKEVKEVLSLSDTGKQYAEYGLPERKILEALDREESIRISDVAEKTGLEPSEVNIAIGWLFKKKWAALDKGEITITPQGRGALNEESDDELLLDKLLQTQQMLMDPSKMVKEGLNLLKKRKNIIKIKKQHKFTFELTDKGRQIIEKGIIIRDQTTQLTHSDIKTGRWKELEFRPYDVQAEYPKLYPGKMHPLQRTIEKIRDIFIKLGFTESRGTILESAFWNFDCLFQPQDHAAREMQDTFYIKVPQMARLPGEELVRRVSQVHETGGDTGSEGWEYQWDEEVARQSVLRTHTTCVSARFLEDNQPPLKMFSVGRVFRRETITYKHLPEFHQVEGIIASEDINFENLLGIIKEFYHKLGFEVRFRPAYFPYTYLSTECEIYLPEKESWIELGGSGMFRPEVLEPLGVETPVAAFGLGIERLAMMLLDITDIRMLYQSDLGWLRDLPVTQL
ncbi:MAG TPA: phenylalanine--tRNA ligase subunit alpha [Methanobacterium sp.]|nr:phenylalanine--tRNA ligase subunit alpha [Methanobacterium sp.]